MCAREISPRTKLLLSSVGDLSLLYPRLQAVRGDGGCVGFVFKLTASYANAHNISPSSERNTLQLIVRKRDISADKGYNFHLLETSLCSTPIYWPFEVTGVGVGFLFQTQSLHVNAPNIIPVISNEWPVLLHCAEERYLRI